MQAAAGSSEEDQIPRTERAAAGSSEEDQIPRTERAATDLTPFPQLFTSTAWQTHPEIAVKDNLDERRAVNPALTTTTEYIGSASPCLMRSEQLLLDKIC